MDLTDINPTIISTDNEEDDHTETAHKKKKTVKSYKNPVVNAHQTYLRLTTVIMHSYRNEFHCKE